MQSKFILAKFIDTNGKENKLVFYYGILNMQSFNRLSSALRNYGYLDEDKPLFIYHYQRDREFRKIKPDVERLFDGIKVELKSMEPLSNIPNFMSHE